MLRRLAHGHEHGTRHAWTRRRGRPACTDRRQPPARPSNPWGPPPLAISASDTRQGERRGRGVGGSAPVRLHAQGVAKGRGGSRRGGGVAGRGACHREGRMHRKRRRARGRGWGRGSGRGRKASRCVAPCVAPGADLLCRRRRPLRAATPRSALAVRRPRPARPPASPAGRPPRAPPPRRATPTSDDPFMVVRPPSVSMLRPRRRPVHARRLAPA